MTVRVTEILRTFAGVNLKWEDRSSGGFESAYHLQNGIFHKHEMTSKIRESRASSSAMQMHILVAISIFFLAIALAYAALRLYDLPVREWLKGKLFSAPR